MARTVLIVDDSPTIRRITRFFLKDEGFELVEAEDGLGALGLVRSRPVDLIIADLQMPNLSGMDLLRELRSGTEARLRDLPVVLLTMQSDPGVRASALAAGASAFLSKPVEPKTLVETVLAALEGR